MIAPWLQEILYGEWDWRAALRRIAAGLRGTGAERALTARDVARALEHVEPDRRFAIATYRLAGAEHDDGRALELAVESGRWDDVSQLAMQARTSIGSIDAMVSEAWALLELGQAGRVRRLVPASPADPRLRAVRAELAGPQPAAVEQWRVAGEARTGAAAAEAYLITARLARAGGRDDWRQWLVRALGADPSSRWAASLALDARWNSGPTAVSRLLEVLRLRLSALEGQGDLAGWCDVARDSVARLWFAQDQAQVRGLARRLLTSTLERAYAERVPEIPGHLALWSMLDEAATADESRVETLRLLVTAIESPVPTHDHVWLAALGADICSRVGNQVAAQAYAAVVAEHAPRHPAAREWYGHSTQIPLRSEVELESFQAALQELEVAACADLEIEDMSPIGDDEELVLGPGGGAALSALPEPGRDHTDYELAAELAGVDELVLSQAPQSEDAVINAALAAVEAALREPVDAGDGSGRVPSRPTAVLGSDAAGAWVPPWIRRAPRVAAHGGPGTDSASPTSSASDATRRRTTELGQVATQARTPAGAPRAQPPAVTPPSVQVDPMAVVSLPRLPSAPAAIIPGAARTALAGTRAAKAATPRSVPISTSSEAARTRRRTRSQPVAPQLANEPAVEARAKARALVPADLRLQLGDREITVTVRDVSVSGMFAVTSDKLPVGAVYSGELRLLGPNLVEEVYPVEVRVVRRTALGVGLELISPAPPLLVALAGGG